MVCMLNPGLTPKRISKRIFQELICKLENRFEQILPGSFDVFFFHVLKERDALKNSN